MFPNPKLCGTSSCIFFLSFGSHFHWRWSWSQAITTCLKGLAVLVKWKWPESSFGVSLTRKIHAVGQRGRILAVWDARSSDQRLRCGRNMFLLWSIAIYSFLACSWPFCQRKDATQQYGGRTEESEGVRAELGDARVALSSFWPLCFVISLPISGLHLAGLAAAFPSLFPFFLN
jgi:hypothetical protein